VKKTLLVFGFCALFASFAHATDIKGDILDQEDYDPDTPYFQIMPPSWSFGFRSAIKAFPIKSSTGNVYELFAERMVPFQKLGILSLGVHLGTAPFSSSNYENLKYGALLRYQLHSTARDGFESIGLLRSYLSLEVRPLSLTSSALTTSSTLWFLGIRLETE